MGTEEDYNGFDKFIGYAMSTIGIAGAILALIIGGLIIHNTFF